jgi:hypothetical protein
MKVVITIVSVLAIALLAFTAMDYFQRYGTVDGIIYLEGEDDRVRPVPGIHVFLIKDAIFTPIDSLLKWYQKIALPLEAEVETIKREVDMQKAALDAEAVLLGETRRDNQDYVTHRQRYLQRYQGYQTTKQPLDSIQTIYNQTLQKLIEDYHTRQVITNAQGRFEISNIRAGYWYVYAYYGNFLGNISWLERVQIRGRTRVLLSRKNATTLLK